METINKRPVFFLSDGTGITAELLGQTLLSQFDSLEFDTETIPYIDDAKKAQKVIRQINNYTKANGVKPVVFATFVDGDIKQTIASSACDFYDVLQPFVASLEKTLNLKASNSVGRAHSMINHHQRYQTRIDAVNYALRADDGANPHLYDQADVILVGVSRSGKTPTSLYLALQFGVFAANYPLTDDDLEHMTLPKSLEQFKNKLYGLTINAERLIAIRNERRPESQYASRRQCEHELKVVAQLFKRERIPYLNSTMLSIEELSTKIMDATGVKRRII